MAKKHILAGAAFLVALCLGGIAQAACELKVGSMGPMSGPAAQWGIAPYAATELAAAEANAQGGLQVGGEKCKVVVIPYDSKYTAEGAAAGANNLFSQGVLFLVGPIGAPEVTGIKPIAARNGMLLFSDSYAKNAIGPQWPMVFHEAPGPSAWALGIIRAAKAKFPMKKVALVAPNDQGGTDIASVDATFYRQEGVEATEEYYQRGTTNFAPIVTRILATNPDVVDTASSPPGDAGIIIKQLRQAGFNGPIGRLGGPGTDEIVRVAGGIDVVKNFYWYEQVPTEEPKVRALNDLYRKLAGKEPPEGTSWWGWVPAARMLLAGISKAGTITDPKKVAEALRTLPPRDANVGEGIWSGQAFFGINQELFLPYGFGLIVNGKNLGVTRVEPPRGS